jgi:hypothetical protein
MSQNRYKDEWECSWVPAVLLTICVLGLVVFIGAVAFLAATGEGMGW